MMKIKNLALIAGVVLIAACSGPTESKSKENPLTKITGNSTYKKKEKTKAENVKIVKEYSDTWAVKGMLRNTSSSTIKGFVKIKFLNASGDVVKTAKAKLNDGDALKAGRAGSFEYYTSSSDFNGVKDFEIIFVDL